MTRPCAFFGCIEEGVEESMTLSGVRLWLCRGHSAYMRRRRP